MPRYAPQSEPSAVSRILSPAKVTILVLALLASIFFMFSVTRLVENLDQQELMVIQSPISGKIHWYTQPGLYFQGFGKVTKYPRRATYEFTQKVRFNDGGHAELIGSIQYELPLDEKLLNTINQKFATAENLQKSIIETVVNKSVYMTGPLMSSKESYSEKRNSLIQYVEDQVENGVYKTIQRDVTIKDPITGEDKNGTVVDILMDPNGKVQRQEQSVLGIFGIKSFNFSIKSIDYEDSVEKQIKQQQTITMSVQTSVADAKKAEQQAITAEQQGRAEAAKAKWEQEVIKAKKVTEAQQELEVATLDAQKAAEEKRAKILRAEGESEYKRKIMMADGALEQKLQAYIKVSEMNANAIANYKGNWVPGIVMGADGSKAQNNGAALLDLLTAKTAKDLSLDLSLPADAK